MRYSSFSTILANPFKLKLRKPELLPKYYDRGDFEGLVRQAELGLYQRPRHKGTETLPWF